MLVISLDLNKNFSVFDKQYFFNDYFDSSTKVFDFDVVDDFVVDNVTKKLHIKSKIDIVNDVVVFYCAYVDENNNELYFDEFLVFKLSDRLRFFNDGYYKFFVVSKISLLNQISDNVSDFYTQLFTFKNDIETKIDNIDLSSVENRVINAQSSIEAKIDNIEDKIDFIDCNVDFAPVLNKIDDLKKSLNISDLTSDINYLKEKLGVYDVTKIVDYIENKLTQTFELKSLNGSNGAKFRDGDSVIVDGYEGNWKVKGSYITLTKDNVSTIIYLLVQDKRIMLVPAPFVKGV